MIDQFRTLHRVKQLREEKCQRSVQAKRAEVNAAEQAFRQARKKAEENRTVMVEREQRIYAPLVGKVVAVPKIEIAKEKVVELQRQHQQLVDAVKRAEHILESVKNELNVLRKEHREAIIVRDKYQMTKEGLEAAHNMALEAKEEQEIEEMYARQKGLML